MTETRYTPGPWMIIPQSDGSAMIAHEYKTVNQTAPKKYRLISHVMARKDSLEADEANARLIAAAPDLLAALEAYLNDHNEDADNLREDAGFENPSGGCDCDLCKAARAAIDKATSAQ